MSARPFWNGVLTHDEPRQAAMVANQNSLAAGAAMRQLAKVYGMPDDEICNALNLIQLAPNHASVVTGPVEAQFSTVTLTVRESRNLTSHDRGMQGEPIEEAI